MGGGSNLDPFVRVSSLGGALRCTAVRSRIDGRGIERIESSETNAALALFGNPVLRSDINRAGHVGVILTLAIHGRLPMAELARTASRAATAAGTQNGARTHKINPGLFPGLFAAYPGLLPCFVWFSFSAMETARI
jgi:hypothetical protein